MTRKNRESTATRKSKGHRPTARNRMAHRTTQHSRGRRRKPVDNNS